MGMPAGTPFSIAIQQALQLAGGQVAGDRLEGGRLARAAAAAGSLRGHDRRLRVPAGEAALWPNSRRVGARAMTASDASLSPDPPVP